MLEYMVRDLSPSLPHVLFAFPSILQLLPLCLLDTEAQLGYAHRSDARKGLRHLHFPFENWRSLQKRTYRLHTSSHIALMAQDAWGVGPVGISCYGRKCCKNRDALSLRLMRLL